MDDDRVRLKDRRENAACVNHSEQNITQLIRESSLKLSRHIDWSADYNGSVKIGRACFGIIRSSLDFRGAGEISMLVNMFSACYARVNMQCKFATKILFRLALYPYQGIYETYVYNFADCHRLRTRYSWRHSDIATAGRKTSTGEWRAGAACQ